jgi:hypothetical protein
VILAVLAGSAMLPAQAQAALTVTPITWDVVGLDSNNVNVGPNTFPVGARVCSNVAASNVQATLVWDSFNPYLNLRPGSATSLPVSPSVVNLGAGQCSDFYFEVEVTRNASAYDTVRRYHIALSADGGATTGSTPVPRQLYVEHLISQNRNSVTDILAGPVGGPLTSVSVGANLNLFVGSSYDIQIAGSTAPGGYENLESFINIPNVIFQVLAVKSIYGTTGGSVTNPHSLLYADGCGYVADPLSPNYRSCTGTGKVGNSFTITYTVKILSIPGPPLLNPSTLSTLVHDYSGSSYHYNADYGSTTRGGAIIDPTLLGFAKSFTPSTTTTGGVSTLTFTISNPYNFSISGLNFTDTFPITPGSMLVASPATFSTSGCGTPTFSPTAGAGSISFSNGTVGANGTCSISVAVIAPATGTYNNTSGTLFIDTNSTGLQANASLLVTSAPPGPACTAGLVLAQWTIPVGQTNPATVNFQSSSVSGTATASYSGTGTSAVSTLGNPANSWGVTNGWASSAASSPGYPSVASPAPYFEFTLNTSNYSAVAINYDARIDGNWAASNNNFLYTYSAANGGGFTNTNTLAGLDKNASSFTNTGTLAAANAGTNTTTQFRINAVGAQNSTARLMVDNVTITGCRVPTLPTLTKAFSPNPIAVNGTSTLVFTITNPNDNVTLTGLTFTDALPSGVQVAGTPSASTTCGGTPTWAPTAGATSLTFGSPTGATLAASSTCTVSVNVTATTAGPHTNVSGFISSTQTGINATTTGSATATLTAVSPPVIAKSFGTDPILAGGTSTITFTIANPNLNNALTGVAFSDTFPVSPGAMVVASPTGASTSGCGTPTFSPTAGAGSVSFSGGTIAAGGTCTVTVNVTAPTAGNYTNTTGSVSHIINAATVNGNTATDTLGVNAATPHLSLLKQVGPSSSGPWSSFLATTAGSSVFFKFTIENDGLATVTGITLSDDTMSVAGCTWVRTSDSATLTPPFSLAVGDSATCSNLSVSAGTNVYVTNTATVTGSGGTSDTSSAAYATASLVIVKIATESSFGAAGVVLHYTYGVTNTGALGLTGPITIADDKSTDESCPALTTVGDLDSTLDPGETIVCTATYTVQAADETAGFVTNIASATAANGGSPVTSNTDTVTVPVAPAQIDLAVDKTDSTLSIESGGTTTYTVTVSNNGPDIDSATLSDPAVTGLTKTSIGTCSASGGATCPTAGNGAGQLGITNLEAGTVVIPTLPMGGSISFTVTCSVTATDPSSLITNSVTVTKQSVGLTETSGSNNTDTDSDVLAQNFGHLPSSYGGLLNLLAFGGARTLSGSTYLGAGKTTASDGINTASFTPKATDDGVTWTPAVTWSAGGTGSLDILVTCPSSPCFLNGWLDWIADSDFNDTNEQLFNNVAVGSGQAGCVLVSGNTYRCTKTFPIPSGALLDGRTLFSRFRLSNAAMGTSSPAFQATSSGGTPLIGEIEDWPFQVQNGSVPTPVTVGFFRARREGNAVVFRWSTASETGNVGFNLYAQRGKELVRLNAQLIPSKVVDSLEAQNYAFRVEGIEDEVFAIEDVSVFGEARRHGPFRADRYYGGLLQDEKVDWAAVQAEDATVREIARQDLRAEKARAWGAAQSVGTANLVVRKTGIQRVTYESMAAAGLAVPDSPQKVRLTNRGADVPIYVSGKKLGPGSWFEFYGQALDTIYTSANVYTLTLGGNGPSKDVAEADGTPSLAPTVPASYTETFVMDNQRAYANYSPSAEAWYDTMLLVFGAGNTWSFPFQLDALADPSAPATMELVAWGVTNQPVFPDHHLIASLNGTPVADETFEALVEKKMTVAVPPGTLQSGANVLQLRLPADTGAAFDLENFDRMRISYQRQFKATDGRLTFTAAGRDFRVTNLPASDVIVYRLDQQGLRRLRNVLVQPDGAGFAATFAGSSATATYVVTTGAALYAPTVELYATRTDLRRPAQYLVISSPNFIDQLQPLVSAREHQGLSVNVVDVNDVYAAYSSGVFDPQAIKSYLSYAATSLGTKSVLLVGGDTYDYRNYLGIGSMSFIPSLYTATGPTVRFVPSDALYTDFDNDGVPNLAIGRFPVRTRAELDTVLAKTLAYDAKTYLRTAAFTADIRAGGLWFKDISASLLATLPPGWVSESINLDDMDVNSARNQLTAAMNRGTALVTYTGHSGPREWTFQGLFNTTYAANLTNAGRPFVVLQWGCWNTYYVDPVNQYLVQSLLFSGDRGAAAVLGASTLTDAGSEQLLGQLLTPRLAIQGMTVGQALQDAKVELARTHPELADVLVGWSLMGDPGLVVTP